MRKTFGRHIVQYIVQETRSRISYLYKDHVKFPEGEFQPILPSRESFSFLCQAWMFCEIPHATLVGIRQIEPKSTDESIPQVLCNS
jgi:hypothetical protein